MSSSFSNFLNAILGDSSDIVYNGNSFSLSIGDSTLSLGTFLSDGQESSHVVITNPGNIPTEASQAGGATETSTVASEVGSIATETIPWRGKGSFTVSKLISSKWNKSISTIFAWITGLTCKVKGIFAHIQIMEQLNHVKVCYFNQGMF